MWQNRNDASMRLSQTVFRYQGTLVYCNGIRDDMVVEAFLLENREDIRFSLKKDVEKLDFEPIPLGYINKRGRASYLTRIPARRWKQGLCAQSLTNIGEKIRGANEFLVCKELVDTVNNNYPSLNRTLERIKRKNLHSIAFSREWALEKVLDDVYLMNKGKAVGTVKDDELHLAERYMYLNEALQEALKDA